MNEVTRERELVEAFAVFADTLVADYDVVDLLQHLVERCQALFDIDAVGLLLADPSRGGLDVVASTSEQVRIVEVIQLGAEMGPCIDAYERAERVSVPDIAASRWTEFRESCLKQGFRSVVAIPLRLRRDVIGAMGLFRHEAGELNERDLRASQALADVATIGILHSRSTEASHVLQEQLQSALTSRIAIEQAKGVLAQTHGLDMDQAFARLREYARTNQLHLSDVARHVVDRSLMF